MGADSTRGTSGVRASGNPRVDSFLSYKSNERVLDELSSMGFVDAHTDEAGYILDRCSIHHLEPYLRALDRLPQPVEKTIQAAHNLLTFDRRAQSVLLKFIGIFELQFRAQYIKQMAGRHGDYAIYDDSLFSSKSDHADRVGRYRRSASEKAKRDARVRRIVDGCGDEIPICVGIDCMTLGSLSVLYRDTADADVANSIAESFGCTRTELRKWSKTITDVRNICAHFDPFFIRKQMPSVPMKIRGSATMCPTTSPLYAVVLLAHLIEDMEFESYDRHLIFARNLELEIGRELAAIDDFLYGGMAHAPILSIPFNWRTILHL